MHYPLLYLQEVPMKEQKDVRKIKRRNSTSII